MEASDRVGYSAFLIDLLQDQGVPLDAYDGPGQSVAQRVLRMRNTPEFSHGLEHLQLDFVDFTPATDSPMR